MSYSYHFKILFFYFFSKSFTRNVSWFILFLTVFFILWKLYSFLRVSFYTRTHTKMYDHAPQKHLTNIQVMPLSPQSTTFRGGLFSQGLWLMYKSRLKGSHNHLWKGQCRKSPGKGRPKPSRWDMWLGSKYRSFLLGIDITKLHGCATPVTDSKHTRIPPRHKSMARSRHFEKLFENVLTRYFSKLQFFFTADISLFPLTFSKLQFYPWFLKILILTPKNILTTLNLSFILLRMQIFF